MTLFKSLLLGTAAGIVATAGASAADLPSKKAAPATYVKICDAQGAGFFFLPGTDTCIKIGGLVRVDYQYMPVRNSGVAAATNAYAVRDTADVGLNTAAFYNRAVINFDARTPSAWGTVRTFGQMRMQSGEGTMWYDKDTKVPSLEAAYIQFAGFTIGQGAQPFAFMSSWAFNSAYWTGWPNGVRQLSYTATLGGGFSATAAITDSKGGYSIGTDGNPGIASSPLGTQTWDRNGPVYVGTVRLDQAWGSAQVMGAYNAASNLGSAYAATSATNVNLTNFEAGYAYGAGLSFKLPMLAAGDELQLTAVYQSRMSKMISDAKLNTPSASSWGAAPLGGPAVDFTNGNGWGVGAQLKHFWTSTVRSQVYASYTARKLYVSNTSTTVADSDSTAYSLGTALIWSPVANFDIGIEAQYLRAQWGKGAVGAQFAVSNTAGWSNWNVKPTEDNYSTKVRVERRF